MNKETTNTETNVTMEQPKKSIFKRINWRKVGKNAAGIGAVVAAAFLGAKYGAKEAIDESEVTVHLCNDGDTDYVIPPKTDDNFVDGEL